MEVPKYTEKQMIEARKESFDNGLKSGVEHSTSSPETIARFDENEKEHEEIKNKLNKIELAFFGDGNGHKGMMNKVDEMHEVFTSSRFTAQFIIKAFATVGIIAGAIVGLFEVIKRFK